MSAPLKIFIIYAREDKGYKDDLLKSLKILQNQGLVEPWHDSDIKPGDEWDKEIKAHLRAADIILPIISFDFFDSDYIHRVEIVEAFERYDRGEALIIPIIADSCPWTDYPRLKDFQTLPTDGRPIDDWLDRKKAMSSIYEGVKKIILAKKKKEELQEKEKERKREEARRYFSLENATKDSYQKIEYYTDAIALNPEYVSAFYSRGLIRYNLEQYEEAIKDYNRCIRLDPDYALAYNNRGAAKEKLGHLESARKDYKKAIDIDPDSETAMGNLQRLESKMK